MVPSKYDYGLNQRVTFEDIDNPKKYYYLNVTEVHGVAEKWLPYIRSGNVLEVEVLPHTNQVSKYGNFTVVKEVPRDGTDNNN